MWTLFASTRSFLWLVCLLFKISGLFDRTQAKLYSIRASGRLASGVELKNPKTYWTIFCGIRSHSSITN
jgi:hypothetical protein